MLNLFRSKSARKSDEKEIKHATPESKKRSSGTPTASLKRYTVLIMHSFLLLELKAQFFNRNKITRNDFSVSNEQTEMVKLMDLFKFFFTIFMCRSLQNQC